MSKIRHDFYQTETCLFLTILKRGLPRDSCEIEYSDGSLTVKTNDEVLGVFHLLHPVDPKNFAISYYSSKIEIKMCKLAAIHWECLEKKEEKQIQKSDRNWEKVVKECGEDEKDEDINSLFQNIYASADDDTKKAMIKSMSESGGTVLSTNWKDISKGRVNVKPPDGMEYKQW